nr:hypothetical protein [uncultured Mucilaginibacter sp.]
MKEFLFKKKIGKKGLYCKITYEFEKLGLKQGTIIFDSDDPWYNEIISGSGYFFDKYVLYSNSGYKLTIIDVHGMIIDTTPAVVFYAVVMLLCKETGYIVIDFGFDENGDLILPE